MLTWLESSNKHPQFPSMGDTYFNTMDARTYVYDGVQWIMLQVASENDLNQILMFERRMKIKKFRYKK